MKKSTKARPEVLVSIERVEEFLLAVANPPVLPPQSLGRLVAQHTNKFAEFYRGFEAQDLAGAPLVLTGRVREIWKEPDARVRQWKTFVLRYRYLGRTSVSPPGKSEPVPDWSPLEQALVYLDRHFERFRFCSNEECPAPYYIASARRPTKYCTPICAGPAKRAAKRKWWKTNRAPGARRRKRHAKRR